MTETLGQRIAQRRRMLSISQEALGEKMGVSRQAISKWESDTAIPEVDRLIEMSKLFEVSVGWLLGTEAQLEETDTPLIPIIPAPPEPITPVPDPKPEQQPPREPQAQTHNPLAWISVVCSMVAVVSLVLSIFTFWQVSKKEDAITPMPQSYDDLLAKIDEFQKEVDFLEKRTEQVYDSNIEAKVQIWSNTDLIDGLSAYIHAMPNTSAPLDGPVSLPEFNSWNLLGRANADLTSVEVIFSCIPVQSPEVKYVILFVYLDDESVVSIPCYSSVETYTHYCSIDLEPRNGYRYEVEIFYSDNSRQVVELTGHKMSNLSDGIMPGIEATRVSDTESTGIGTISVSYSDITLAPPSLISSRGHWKFKTLRLAHYQDGELKGTYDLTDLTSILFSGNKSLNFSLAEKCFSTIDTKDGAIHEIRLEGEADLSFETQKVQPFEYSVVLESWENRDGALHLVQ